MIEGISPGNNILLRAPCFDFTHRHQLVELSTVVAERGPDNHRIESRALDKLAHPRNRTRQKRRETSLKPIAIAQTTPARVGVQHESSPPHRPCKGLSISVDALYIGEAPGIDPQLPPPVIEIA